MKKLFVCVLVSLLLHSLLLLIEANPPSGRPAPVNIDIVPKEKPEEPTPPTPEPLAETPAAPLAP
ncbi:MAG: hypothetical protein LBV04_09450, partial [Deferribacteraceae bacterium]|nr:hypothetical protein [Deferribacteraceae bacterium]